MTPCIVGWAHTPFGKHDALDVEGLINEVAGAAITDAGIEPAQVDGVFVGLFNNGFSRQDFPSSLPMHGVDALRFKPATRYENACASGSAAIHGARDFLAAGRGRFALVIGAEKMSATPGPQVGDNLLGASYRREEGDIPAGFAGVFGPDRRAVFPALRRSVGRPGDHRGQEPPQRRGQSLRSDAQGSGLRVLPHRERPQSLRGSAAEAHGLFPGERWRGRPDPHGRGHGPRHGEGRAVPGGNPT